MTPPGPRAGYTRLPRAVLDDMRITNDAKVAFAILADCDVEDNGLSKISFRKIGERLGVSRSTARRVMEQLVNFSHVRNTETVNGKCPVWERLTRTTVGTGTPTLHPLPKRSTEFKSDDMTAEERAASLRTGAPVIESLRARLQLKEVPA